MPDFLTDYFTKLVEGLLTTMKRPDAYLNKIALTAFITIVGVALNMLFKKVITRNVKDFLKRVRLHKALKQTIATFAIIAILLIWIQAMNVLILITLLFGVIAVFMLRGLTTNIIGYFVIKYRHYFEVGHRIELKETIGDVIDINLINFKLMEVRHGLSSDANTGRIIKLPNSIIFDETIQMIGVTNELLMHEIQYVLAFDSDWRAAEKIMAEAGEAYFNETLMPRFVGGKFSAEEVDSYRPVLSVNTNTDGIILVLRYAVDYRQGTRIKTELQRKMLTAIEKNPQIAFATVDVRILRE